MTEIVSESRKNAEKPLFVLASASPRRRELLAACGLCFEILKAEIDENPNPGESPEDLVVRLALLKANTVLAQRPKLPVLSADTVVALDKVIFGKPESLDQAKDMLEKLSGRVHRVITGYCVTGGPQGREKYGLVISKIAFRNLSAAEIDWYLSLNQSMDKAGAYAIQMEGGFLTDWLEGSYTNIVGLPLKETLEALSTVLDRNLFQ
ncbi:MAG: Maf family protein [Deltaproteobacteria bacterium]|jgi:septum formation protein|nr:Maf family protein [Deltaproteobacteria bacterium]